jgi:hypothetical protein
MGLTKLNSTTEQKRSNQYGKHVTSKKKYHLYPSKNMHISLKYDLSRFYEVYILL